MTTGKALTERLVRTPRRCASLVVSFAIWPLSRTMDFAICFTDSLLPAEAAALISRTWQVKKFLYKFMASNVVLIPP